MIIFQVGDIVSSSEGHTLKCILIKNQFVANFLNTSNFFIFISDIFRSEFE